MERPHPSETPAYPNFILNNSFSLVVFVIAANLLRAIGSYCLFRRNVKWSSVEQRLDGFQRIRNTFFFLRKYPRLRLLESARTPNAIEQLDEWIGSNLLTVDLDITSYGYGFTVVRHNHGSHLLSFLLSFRSFFSRVLLRRYFFGLPPHIFTSATCAYEENGRKMFVSILDLDTYALALRHLSIQVHRG